MSRRYAPALILLVICMAVGCGRSRRNAESGLRDGGVDGGDSSQSGRGGAASTAGTFGGRRPDAGPGRGGSTGGVAGPGVGVAAGTGVPGPTPSGGSSGLAGSGTAGWWVGGAGTVGIAGTGGSAGSFVEPTCIWAPGYCVYTNGAQCNGFTCCELREDRCCDGTGRCSAPIPPPPAWVPPIDEDDLGAPGWKTSTDPLCTGPGEFAYGSVWSDSRGVFVTATLYNNTATMMPDAPCFGCPYTAIEHNDGTGWSRLEGSFPYGQQRIKGFDAGKLILYGSAQSPGNPNVSCGLATIDGSTITCQPVDGITDVAVTGSTAYAALQGTLVRYDGTSWGPLPVVFPGQAELYSLWANADVVMGTGVSAGKIYSLRNNVWSIEDTRTLETFTTIFGSSSTDIWAATSQEHLFHYDGSVWTQVTWPGSGCSSPNGVVAIWGKDGTTYFATPSTLARWNGSAVEIVAQWPCGSSAMIVGLWGNSPSEVFVLMADYTENRQPCGTQFLFHYDGTLFHRM